MNNIKTSDVVDPTIQQPFTARSLKFLQDGFKEMVRGVGESILGDTLTSYSASAGVAISGCTYNGPATTIFGGFIYYAGELYLFPGAASLNTFVQTAVVVLDETNDATADPLIFTDTVSRNVHKVRKLKVVDQASGSGLFNLSALIEARPVLKYVNPASYTTASASNETITGSTYTTPAFGTRSFKLRVSANITIPNTGTAYEGGTLWIKNITAATNLKEISVFKKMTNDPGNNEVYAVFTEYEAASIAPSTQFGIGIIRYNVNNVTVNNLSFVIEEYRR